MAIRKELPEVKMPTEEQLKSEKQVLLRTTEGIHIGVRRYAKENDCSLNTAYNALIRLGLQNYK